VVPAYIDPIQKRSHYEISHVRPDPLPGQGRVRSGLPPGTVQLPRRPASRDGILHPARSFWVQAEQCRSQRAPRDREDDQCPSPLLRDPGDHAANRACLCELPEPSYAVHGIYTDLRGCLRASPAHDRHLVAENFKRGWLCIKRTEKSAPRLSGRCELPAPRWGAQRYGLLHPPAVRGVPGGAERGNPHGEQHRDRFPERTGCLCDIVIAAHGDLFPSILL